VARIYTIGYERADIADFVRTLIDARINVLADVRDVPWSRRSDYTKGDLSEVLAAGGIDYWHVKTLGNPTEGRNAAKAGDRDAYRAIYSARLDRATTVRDLAALAERADSRAICLMCYERDPNHCHRLMISERLIRDYDAEIEHLFVSADGQMGLL